MLYAVLVQFLVEILPMQTGFPGRAGEGAIVAPEACEEAVAFEVTAGGAQALSGSGRAFRHAIS